MGRRAKQPHFPKEQGNKFSRRRNIASNNLDRLFIELAVVQASQLFPNVLENLLYDANILAITVLGMQLIFATTANWKISMLA